MAWVLGEGWDWEFELHGDLLREKEEQLQLKLVWVDLCSLSVPEEEREVSEFLEDILLSLSAIIERSRSSSLIIECWSLIDSSTLDSRSLTSSNSTDTSLNLVSIISINLWTWEDKGIQEEQEEESLETMSIGVRGGEKLDVEEDDELDEDEGYLYRLGS